MPLPGPGSCAELTGPLLGCRRKERGVGGSELGSGREERALEDQLREDGGGRGGEAQQITQRL